MTDELFDLSAAWPSSPAGSASWARSTRTASRRAACALPSSTSRPSQAVTTTSAATAWMSPTGRRSRRLPRGRGEWGAPHLLVNNAALDSPPDAPPEEVGPFETYPEASFDEVMDVNVKGVVLCCQVVGAAMAGAGRGSIVNVSSVYGLLSPPQDLYEFRRREGETFFKPVAYSVSKSALLNLTRYLATYWAKAGVRVNTLTLGGIFDEQPQEFLDAYGARVPLGRMADANEALGAVVFLASDASSYVTGANLVVDGGWSAW